MIINLTETDEFQDLTDNEVKEEMLANISEDTMIDDILDQIVHVLHIIQFTLLELQGK